MAFIRFLFVGILGFLIDTGITLALIYLGASPFLARVPAILFAMTMTWYINRNITFRICTHSTKQEVIRYFTFAMSIACLNYVLFTLLIVLSWPVAYAITFSTVIQIVISFYGYKILVFRQFTKQIPIQEKTSLPNLICYKKSQTILWTVALALFLINFYFKYPGELGPDSMHQYAQALSGQYSDWHPPIMAWVWSKFLNVIDGPSTMLTMHIGLHWLGFTLIADAILRIGKPRTASLVMVSGAFPVFLFYNGLILKDIGMASAMLVAFALGFRYRINNKRVPLLVLLLAALLLAYGTLVRANAIFAFGPLFIYLFNERATLANLKQLLLLSILLAGLALPISNYVNHNLLEAKKDEAIQALFLFDLTGIAYHSGDLNVLPPELKFSMNDLQHCYTPYWWDTLSPWGSCSFSWERLGPANSLTRKKLRHRWILEMVKHPLEYTIHRLKVLNSILYFLVPAKHCRYELDCALRDSHTNIILPTTDNDIFIDYIKKNPFVLPINWLVLGVVLLLLSKNIKSVEVRSATRSLLLSGVSTLLFMIFVGVATDIRYAYWSIMSIMLAVIISFDQLKVYYQLKEPGFVFGGVLLFLTVLTGLLSRFFNFTAFI